MSTTQKEKSYTDIEILYSFLNILKIVSNTNDFRLWIKKTHHIENDGKLFVGYQFFIDVVLSRIIHSFERYSSFGIDFDYSMYRASFVGVHIDDIPISCEEVKLLKNFWNHYRPIRKCKNWDQSHNLLEEKNAVVFPVFDRIFNSAIESKTTVPKEDILWGKTLYYTTIYLNDTDRGHPNAYPGTILDSFVNQNNFDKVFPGYVYTLQYLWFHLLSEKDFLQSPASELHKVISLPRKNKKFSNSFMDLFSDDLTSRERHVWAEWQELDTFFSKINDTIIEKKLNPSIRKSELILSEKYEKSMLEPLMHLSSISEPGYLKKQNSFTAWTKLLDSFFFWHEMDVLDTNKVHVFNGAFAFISLLIGEVEKYKMFNDTNPFWIARIKHPVQKGKNDISYGILLQSGGWIIDSSGWLLFLDCGTDYSGAGSYHHEQVEEFVTKYEKDEKISVKEISIPSEIFVRYLRQKSIPSLVQQIKVVTTKIIEQTDIDNESLSPQSIVLQNLQKINNTDIADITSHIEKIVFSLRLFIPKEQKFISIIEKIDQITKTEDVSKKLEIIASIIPLIPFILENNRMESIESKIDNLIVKKSPGPSSKIVISSGVELLGTGAKHELEIPLSEISYEELSEDIKRMIKGQKHTLKQIPSIRTKVIKFLQETQK
jgi:hypothetical protein